MKQRPALALVIFGMMVATVAERAAQTTVILPDTSHTTGVVVNIMEQATVTIPTTTLFTVATSACLRRQPR